MTPSPRPHKGRPVGWSAFLQSLPVLPSVGVGVGVAVVVIVGLLLLPATTAYGQVVDSILVQDDAIMEQLDRDRTLVPMGKGAIFVPYLADPLQEPSYAIFQDDSLITDAQPGKRVPLNPGHYTLHIGSGPLDIRLAIDAEVVEERVRVVIPTWSALVVRTLDQNNNPIRLGYQIFLDQSQIFIGAGIGVDEIMGEKPDIWILKPDLYKVTKRGESADTFRNFVTLRTMPGAASTVRLLFDEITHQLVGGGEIFDDQRDLAQRGNWSFTASLAGNFSFINEGFFWTEENDVNNYTMRTTFAGRIVYEVPRYIFLNRLDVYENFQRPDGDMFRFTKDLIQYESAFIYRISKLVGPYLSVRLRTGIFNQYLQVSEDSNVSTYRIEGALDSPEVPRYLLEPGSNFLYSGRFSPISLTQSAGFNFDYRYGNILNSNLRMGWGLKQDIATNLYDISLNERDILDEEARRTGLREKLIPRVPRLQHSYGPDIAFMFSVMPLSFVEIKEEFEALIPVGNATDVNYISTTSVSVWLSNYASVQYEFLVERNPSISQSIKKMHSVTVQLFYRLL